MANDQNVGNMLNGYTLSIEIWTVNGSYPLIDRDSELEPMEYCSDGMGWNQR